MGKKCFGGYCFENTTLLFGIILVLVGGYLYIRITDLGDKLDRVSIPGRYRQAERCRDMFTDPYAPPIRCDSGYIPTQGYSQIGILRAQLSSDILPLMGRRLARQKWQYYTLSGGGPGGNLQTKLPIKVQGRNCSNEYGCDEIFNKDEVFVEGFDAKFTATIYENGLFNYLP